MTALSSVSNIRLAAPDGIGLLAMPQVVILEGEEGPGIRLSGGEPQASPPLQWGEQTTGRKAETLAEK